MIKKTKGFTLIELLVVIAIIGILSSVVLASLNSARNKGADAAIKSNLANARAEAEMFADTPANNGMYAVSTQTSTAADVGVCAASGANTIGKNKTAAASAGAATTICLASKDTWILAATLKSTTASWCVDAKGNSRQITTQPAAGATECPAS